MPDDNRLDLSVDVNKIGDDLLNDVKAATEQVKKQRASDKAKESKSSEKAKSRQISAIAIAAAAVVLVVIAYFVVFAKPEAPATPTSAGAYSQAPAIKTPGVSPSSTPTKRVAPPQRRRPRPVSRPSNDYEQPGM